MEQEALQNWEVLVLGGDKTRLNTFYAYAQRQDVRVLCNAEVIGEAVQAAQIGEPRPAHSAGRSR